MPVHCKLATRTAYSKRQFKLKTHHSPLTTQWFSKTSVGITLDNVTTDAPAATKFTMAYTDLNITSGGTTLPMPITPGYTISIDKNVTTVTVMRIP